MKRKYQVLIFVVLCVISGVLICSPFVIRIPAAYSMVSWFLQSLNDKEYKIVYIEMIGSLVGTFLAITGALWTQRNIDENNEREKIKKTAAIVYYDLKLNIDTLLETMKVVYPLVKANVLPDDEETIAKFRKMKNKRRIFFVPNWREMVVELQSVLSSEQIRDILILYGKLSMISLSFNAAVNEHSKKEDTNAYNIMQNLFSVEYALTYEIKVKKDIESLLTQLLNVAQMKDKKKGIKLWKQ